MALNAHILAFVMLLPFFFLFLLLFSFDFLQPIHDSRNNIGDADFFFVLLPFKDAFVSSVKRIIHFHRAFFYPNLSRFFHVCRRVVFFCFGVCCVANNNR